MRSGEINMNDQDKNLHADDGRMGVLLLISGLTFGGAERQVIELANKLDPRRYRVTVCALTDDNPMASNLRTDLVVIKKRSKFDIGVVPQLRRLVAERRIDVIHTFLNDANIAGRLCYRRGSRPVIISSERNSNYEESLLRRVVERISRPCMDLMVANSMAGRQFCIDARKMREDQVMVVHNGVDSVRFSQNNEARSLFRKEIGVDDSDVLVGLIGNFKAQKNHHIFVLMAEALAAELPNVRFLVVGNSPEGKLEENPFYLQTVAAAESPELKGRMTILTARSDMDRVHNACDVTVLPSSREGTPNVMLESMACATPVVATDVADNAFVLRDGLDGRVVTLSDAETTAKALADAVRELLLDTEKRSRMGASARGRVEAEFSLHRLAEKTGKIYGDLLGSPQT